MRKVNQVNKHSLKYSKAMSLPSIDIKSQQNDDNNFVGYTHWQQ